MNNNDKDLKKKGNKVSGFINSRILLSLPVVHIRQEKTFHFHRGHYKLYHDQSSFVTEVLLHHHHPQSLRALAEPLHTTCWSESSSGCGRVAGPLG